MQPPGDPPERTKSQREWPKRPNAVSSGLKRIAPNLRKLDKNGNFPALEYTRISIARDLIRARRGVGLSQQRLAELAGVRQETISRLESGKHTAAVKTIERMEKAIAAERQRRQKRKAK